MGKIDDPDYQPDPAKYRHVGPRRPMSAEEKKALALRLHGARRAKAEERKRLLGNLRAVPVLRRLSNRHWEVVMRHLGGYGPKEIAAQLGYRSHTQVSKLLSSDPTILSVLDEVREAQLAKVLAGDFGPQAIAKHHAVPAMNKQVALMESAKSEQVQLAASESVLAHGGHGVAVQVDVLHHILGTLTDSELDDYATGRRIPEKLRNVLPAIDVTPEKKD